MAENESGGTRRYTQRAGVTVTPGTVVVSRLFGYGSLTWQARAAAPSDALRAIVLSVCIADVISLLAALQGVLGGAVNAPRFLGLRTLGFCIGRLPPHPGSRGAP